MVPMNGWMAAISVMLLCVEIAAIGYLRGLGERYRLHAIIIAVLAVVLLLAINGAGR